MKYLALIVTFLGFASCIFIELDFPCSLGKQVIKKRHPEFSITACGGRGPGDLYESIRLSFDIGRRIHLKYDRKEILDTQLFIVDEINKFKKNKKYFISFPVVRKNVSISFLTPWYLDKDPWQISSIGAYTKVLHYTTYVETEDNWDFYDYGEETYEEAERVAYGEGPFERIITYTKYGLNHVPIELHGPWGFFIQRAVIKQIQEGDFIYYALIDGKKHKLSVCNEQVVIEGSGQPLTEVFIPEPWTP